MNDDDKFDLEENEMNDANLRLRETYKRVSAMHKVRVDELRAVVDRQAELINFIVKFVDLGFRVEFSQVNNEFVVSLSNGLTASSVSIYTALCKLMGQVSG